MNSRLSLALFRSVSFVLVFVFIASNITLAPARAQVQAEAPAGLDFAPETTNAALLFCDGTGSDDRSTSSSGFRFTINHDFEGVELRLAADAEGTYKIKAELRRSSGFTTTPIATTTVTIHAGLGYLTFPYSPFVFDFGTVDVSGTQTFTLKLIKVSGPGNPIFEYRMGDTCANMAATEDNTGSNPAAIGEAAGLKVVDVVYQSPYEDTPIYSNGNLAKDEWLLKDTIPFNGGFVALQNDRFRLYVLIDVIDDTYADSAPEDDYFYLSFDTNGDSAITPGIDLNYRLDDSNGNMRYQYYEGDASWSDLQPSTFSSRARGFGCSTYDDSYGLLSLWPLRWGCSKHRIWELAIDLDEIRAREGDVLHMGFMVFSQNPDINESVPFAFYADFEDLLVVQLAHKEYPSGFDPYAGAWLESPFLEVTQAVQDDGNSAPLVAGKTTVVRVYGSTYYIQKRQLLRAYLFGVSASADLPGSPLAMEFEAAVDGQIDRSAIKDTANFLLPSFWTKGAVGMDVAVKVPLGGSQDGPYGIHPYGFQVRDVPTIWYLPVNEGTKSSPVLMKTKDMDKERSYVEAVYPVAKVDWVKKSWKEVEVNPTDVIAALNKYLGLTLWSYLTSVWQTGTAPFTFPDQIYGFAQNGNGKSNAVWNGGYGYVAKGFHGANDDTTMAHEMNHNWDRSKTGTWGRHVVASCGAGGPDPNWPFTNDDTHEIGFDTRKPWMQTSTEKTVIPDNAPDFMSYCTSGYSPAMWTSMYRWENLFNFFVPPTASEAAQEDIVDVYYVSGVLHADGSGSLNPVSTLPGTPDVSEDSTTAAIEIRGAGNSLLYTHNFNAQFFDDPKEDFNTLNFIWMVPAQAGAQKIVLKYLGVVVDEIIVSAHAPSVTLTAPNGGQSWSTGPQTATWSASDQDGDPLTYSLLYSPDNGNAWFPVATDITTTSYELDASLLPEGSQAILRVIVTDGVNTAHDDSNAPFTVAGKAPEVNIMPLSEDGVVEPGLLILQGEAYDLEDQEIPDDNFVWMIGDEVIGVGPTIEALFNPGRYTITLYVGDSDDNTGSATLEIFAPGSFVYMPAMGRNFNYQLSTISDPSGDWLSGATHLNNTDILSASAERKSGEGVVVFSMTVAANLPHTLPANERNRWFWLLDSDRNPATGDPWNDIGVEYQVNLHVQADGYYVDVRDWNNNWTPVPDAATFSGATVTVRIPVSYLGGADRFDWMAAVSPFERDPGFDLFDIAPNTGFGVLP